MRLSVEEGVAPGDDEPGGGEVPGEGDVPGVGDVPGSGDVLGAGDSGLPVAPWPPEDAPPGRGLSACWLPAGWL